MPRQPVDFRQTTVAALSSVVPLPQEAAAPLAHYRRASADAWNLVQYVARNVSRTNHYPAAFARHMGRLRGLAVAHTVGAFERFLKETAAECIDHISAFVLDGRLDEFSVKGGVASAHFGAATVGDALCESDTWLNCNQINTRFRKLLAEPFESGNFYVFPGSTQLPADERFRFEIIAAIFQMRHTLVHNLGVLTKSDATKLGQILKTQVQPDQVFTPTLDDVRYLKRFVDETAARINERVAQRLSELLTTMHTDGHLAFDPAQKATDLAAKFGVRCTVAGATRP